MRSAQDGVGLNPSGGRNANLTRLGIARARINGCRRASVIGAACSHAQRTVDDRGEIPDLESGASLETGAIRTKKRQKVSSS